MEQQAEQNEQAQARISAEEADSAAYLTPGQLMVRRFFREKTAVCGLVFVVLLLLSAVAAPPVIKHRAVRRGKAAVGYSKVSARHDLDRRHHPGQRRLQLQQQRLGAVHIVLQFQPQEGEQNIL